MGLLLVFAGPAQAADEASAATGTSPQAPHETQATPVAGQAALQMPQGPGPAPGPGLATPGAISYAPMQPTSAAQAARHNLASAVLRDWSIQRWDAARLPLRDGEAGKVISNLPFGRQISSESDIAPLYAAALDEVARVLAMSGAAIVLTEQVEALERASAQAGLRMVSLAKLSLKGLHPQVLRLEHT